MGSTFLWMNVLIAETFLNRGVLRSGDRLQTFSNFYKGSLEKDFSEK